MTCHLPPPPGSKPSRLSRKKAGLLVLVVGTAVIASFLLFGCSSTNTSCKTDADCPLKTAPVCSVATGTCVSPTLPQDGGAGDGGAGDASPDADMTSGFPLGTDCQQNDDCQSGYCTDGVCCEQANCGPCKRCNTQTEKGRCQASDTPSDCAISNAACSAECVGGQCDWSSSNGIVCIKLCDTTEPHLLNTAACAEGACTAAQTTTDCDPYLCDDSSASGRHQCKKDCDSHDDCKGGDDRALCDRTNAHQRGAGVCVDPDDVTPVADDAALDNYLKNASRTPWAKLTGAGYTEVYTIGSGQTVALAAANENVVFNPTATNKGAIFTVGETQATTGASLTLQGVTLTEAQTLASNLGNGIECLGSATAEATLNLIETTIERNNELGISSDNCALTVRRSTITSNGGGGIRALSSTVEITNTLIRENGRSNSTTGGVWVDSNTALTFIHNTVVENASGTNVKGVVCNGSKVPPQTLTASIITGEGPLTSLSCNTDDSKVYTTSETDLCNLNPSWMPQDSACLNTVARRNDLLVDHYGNQRNALTDFGCFEVTSTP